MERSVDCCQRSVQLEGLSVETRSAEAQAHYRGPHSVHSMIRQNGQYEA